MQAFCALRLQLVLSHACMPWAWRQAWHACSCLRRIPLPILPSLPLSLFSGICGSCETVVTHTLWHGNGILPFYMEGQANRKTDRDSDNFHALNLLVLRGDNTGRRARGTGTGTDGGQGGGEGANWAGRQAGSLAGVGTVAWDSFDHSSTYHAFNTSLSSLISSLFLTPLLPSPPHSPSLT